MNIKLNQSRFRGSYRQLFLTGLCLFLILGVLHNPLVVQSATINQARITEILDSNQVYINGNQVAVNAIATKGQRVSTRNARAQLSFNTGAVGRLAHNSVLTIGQCANLQRGTLLVNGAVNGCTNSTTAGVRGTTYVMTVNETGQEEIQVLEGEVVLSKQVNPGIEDGRVIRGLGKKGSAIKAGSGLIQDELVAQEEETVKLTAGEKVEVLPNGEVGEVQLLTAEEFGQLLTGQLFNNFTDQLPGIDKIKESFQKLFPGVSFPLSLPDIPSTPPIPELPF